MYITSHYIISEVKGLINIHIYRCGVSYYKNAD